MALATGPTDDNDNVTYMHPLWEPLQPLCSRPGHWPADQCRVDNKPTSFPATAVIWAHFANHIIIIIIIIIIILTAIGLAPGGSSPVHIYREHYIEYTNNAQNT